MPPFRKGSGRGWVTAEYAMLPRSTQTRSERDGRKGRVDGRVQEIQRLIGRSLRAAVDFEALGERSILIDCDVMVADGGTRTASITGGYVALALAIARLRDARVVRSDPLRWPVAAVSAGIVAGEARLDLCYLEDSAAETDMNCVGSLDGRFIELQGSAEQEPFSRAGAGFAPRPRRRRAQAAVRAPGGGAERSDVSGSVLVLATRNPGKLSGAARPPQPVDAAPSVPR